MTASTTIWRAASSSPPRCWSSRCALLRADGFDQFHFYTLNQAELTFAVCNMLGIKPAQTQQAIAS